MASPAAAARRVVTVDVVSDTICPWCYVGAQRFKKAAAAASAAHGMDFVVRWRPFYLDPGLPAEGVDKMTRYTQKFGAQRVAQMLPMMKAVGAREGIAFSFGGKIAATKDSHRLLELAFTQGGPELQNRLVYKLFNLYFEQEGNIGDRAALADAAAAAGMDRDAVAAFLASGELAAEVDAEVAAWARKYRISGVPFFVVDGKYTVEGAQEPEAFGELFDELAERAAR